MSKAAAPLAPSSLAIVVATAGVWWRWVTVETITVSIWPGLDARRGPALCGQQRSTSSGWSRRARPSAVR